jgi:hypothetical protein
MHEIKRLIPQILVSWAAEFWPWESADEHHHAYHLVAMDRCNHCDIVVAV